MYYCIQYNCGRDMVSVTHVTCSSNLCMMEDDDVERSLVYDMAGDDVLNDIC